jgi:acyl carrier protein
MSDVFERFKPLAVQVLAVDADSLDLAELVMALEDEFDITVEEEELEGITTVQNALDLVSGKLPA